MYRHKLPFLLIAVVLTQTDLTLCKITPEPLPAPLHQCFDSRCKGQGYDKEPAETIAITCLSNYLWNYVGVRCHDMPESSLNYIGSLLAPYLGHSGRHRRQTSRRRRKEYRHLTIPERRTFHRALERLKNEGEYDIIAGFHNNGVRLNAHAGASFLPWHRIYIFIFETALRSKEPTVTLPYWDCSLEPTDDRLSIIWSDDFMGGDDGTGQLNGVVRGWQLTRNQRASDVGILLDDAEIRRLLEITSTGLFRRELEQAHNGIHAWFAPGNLVNLEGAAFDPVFFLLHCFIDYIWWQWQSNNEDKAFTFQYPSLTFINDIPGNRDPHMASSNILRLNISATGLGIREITNEEGYGRGWAFDFVEYEAKPNCTSNPSTCSNQYLSCNSENRCVSSAAPPTRQRWQSWPWWLGRRRRSTHGVIKTDHHLNDIKVQINHKLAPIAEPIQIPHVPDIIHLKTPNAHFGPHFGHHAAPSSVQNQCHGMSLQNDFQINCNSDSRLWAYLPVKVVHIRPAGKMYRSHLVSHGKIEHDMDMYNEFHYKKIQQFIKPENPKCFKRCEDDAAGVMKVTVTTQGLNYRGMYQEYIILDNRQPIDGKVGYVAFKRPDKKMASKVFLTAFDQCGRICTPKCRVRKGKKVSYQPCSGVLNIDDRAPRRYGNTYGEAVLQYWKFSEGACPSAADDNIAVVFYCEYKNKWWPWK